MKLRMLLANFYKGWEGGPLLFASTCSNGGANLSAIRSYGSVHGMGVTKAASH